MVYHWRFEVSHFVDLSTLFQKDRFNINDASAKMRLNFSPNKASQLLVLATRRCIVISLKTFKEKGEYKAMYRGNGRLWHEQNYLTKAITLRSIKIYNCVKLPRLQKRSKTDEIRNKTGCDNSLFNTCVQGRDENTRVNVIYRHRYISSRLHVSTCVHRQLMSIL